MRRVNDPLCPLCKEEDKTSLHFLGICPPRDVKYFEYSSQFGLITGIATLLTSTTDLTGQEKRPRPTWALETFQIRRAILTHRLIQTLQN